MRAEWLLEVTLLASGLAVATGSIVQSDPSVGPAFLVGWVHGMIYCGTLWLRLGGIDGGDELAFEDWDNMVSVDCTSVAVGR